MTDTRIHKATIAGSATPRIDDDAPARAGFTWDAAERMLSGLPDGRGLNIAHEAVDRHATGPRGEAVALRWIDAQARAHEYTYRELQGLTARFAHTLERLGVAAGDHVFSLLDRMPELHVTILGALKTRSVFCPLFSGYGPEPLRTRLSRGRARVLVTTPELYRRKIAGIRSALPRLEHVILVGDRREGMQTGEHVWCWRELLDAADDVFTIPPTSPSDPALLHFTSGTTGPPKGALHAHRAVVAQHATARSVLDLQPTDVYWCTADPGWVTSTVYGVIAPLTVGATVFLDTAPFEAGRWCHLAAEQRITVWYTTPTAVRMLQRLGHPTRPPSAFTALRMLATVGEPLDATSVRWGLEAFGTPVHDTWWQTETGAIMVANSATVDIEPGSMGFAVPGIDAAIVRPRDASLPYRADPSGHGGVDRQGELAIRSGWPSMFTAYLDDPARYQDCFREGWYLTGDLARQDAEGRFWFIGRADDLIKSSGHLVGPFEVESVLLEHPAVAEVAVVGRPDPIAHEIIVAIVSLKETVSATDALRMDLLAHARTRLGAAVAPKEISFRQDLPKTPSGKILRRVLKENREPPPDDRSRPGTRGADGG